MRKIKFWVTVALAAIVMLAGISPTLAVTTSDINMQVNVKDVVAPPNVSNFTAAPGDRHTTLTWTNPSSSDFSAVKIQRSDSYYPTAETEGTTVYNGAEASYVDIGLVNGSRYYYTAFSYDAAGNYSSGSIATVIPTEPTVAKSVEPEKFVLPPAKATEGPAKKTKIDLSDFKFYLTLSGGPLEIGLNELNELVVVKGATLAVAIPANIFAKEVNVMTITLGGSSYLIKKNAAADRFETAFVVPPVKGDYQATIVIVYKDGTVQTLQSKFIVDPYGYVYERSFNFLGLKLGGEMRIEKAEVTLYQKVNDAWQKWPADQFNQKNPSVTNQAGEFSFLAPNGSYYLVVKKSGYPSVQTAPFEIKDSIVNTNLEMNPYWKTVIFYIILGLIVVGLLGLLLKRRRSHIDKR